MNVEKIGSIIDDYDDLREQVLLAAHLWAYFSDIYDTAMISLDTEAANFVIQTAEAEYDSSALEWSETLLPVSFFLADADARVALVTEKKAAEKAENDRRLAAARAQNEARDRAQLAALKAKYEQ